MLVNLQQQQQGTAISEVVVGFLIFIPALLLFLDCCLLLNGAAINTAIVTDAAKAASAGPPGQLTQGRNRLVLENQSPYKRAYAVVDSRRANLSAPYELGDIITITETVQAPLPIKPFGGALCGSTTVTTSILIHPKFILNLFKIDPVRLTASRTFPYSWIMPSEMFQQTSGEATHKAY